jgi:isoleucyl-tRNA synthetase
VHMALFPERESLEALEDRPLMDRWARLIEIRDRVNATLEEARQRKTIGNSLAARVELDASGEDAGLLERYRAELPMLFIASQVDLRRAGGDGQISIAVERADGTKCPRCWRIVPRLDAEGVCDRCAEALAETVV